VCLCVCVCVCVCVSGIVTLRQEPEAPLFFAIFPMPFCPNAQAETGKAKYRDDIFSFNTSTQGSTTKNMDESALVF